MSKLLKIGLVGLGALAVSAAASAQEYRSNMTQIGVTPALHAAQGTGVGIKIGIFDGLADPTHYDLEGRVLNFTYAGGVYTKYANHGTHVAGIAAAGANGQGVVGVAPGATIYSYGVFDDTSWRATDLGRAAFDSAKLQGVSVVNMSYGPSAGGGDLFLTGELNVLKDYKTSMVLVRSAGNSSVNARYEYYAGDASTDLGHLLIVGSVDSNNRRSSFSNRAGSSCIGPVSNCTVASGDRIANFFIVAPGRSIVSDLPNDSLGTMSGTSMAAPHVTGAVALLQGRWPHLLADPVSTASIIKQTVTDLGNKGVDSTYGWGLLNVPQALQPVGTTVVATGSTVGQGGTALSSSGFVGASTMPGGRGAASALSGLVVFDDFGRDFETALPEVAVAEPSRNIEDRLGELSNMLSIVPAAGPSVANISLGFQGSVDVPNGQGFSVASFAGDGFSVKLGQGGAGLYFQSSDTGAAAGKAPSLGRHLMLGLNEAGEAFEQGSFADATLALSEDVSLGAFFASSAALSSTDAPGGLAAALSQRSDGPEADMVGFQTSYGVSEGVTLGVSYGRLTEQDQLLGATTTGAFALSETTTTQTYGASLSLALGNKLSAVMFYDYATVDAPAASGSLYQGIED